MDSQPNLINELHVDQHLHEHMRAHSHTHIAIGIGSYHWISFAHRAGLETMLTAGWPGDRAFCFLLDCTLQSCYGLRW